MTYALGKISQMTSSIEWEIENFSALSSKPGDLYESSEFKCYDAAWNLMIYPNGPKEDFSGFVSLFLKLRRSLGSSRIVNFKISIKNTDGSDFISKNTIHVFTENNCWGWRDFVERSELLKQLNFYSLRISCTITYDSSVPGELSQSNAAQIGCSTSNPVSLERITRSLNDLFFNKIDTDVIVKVQEHRIPAHKLILAARSSVFADMLQEGTEESNKRILEITDFQPDNVEDFLLYVYCGCTDRITLENAFELYRLSDKFYVEDLKTTCVEFLKNNLSTKNICDVLLFAKKHNEKSLWKVAKRFLADNASDILPSYLWEKFRNENNIISLDTLQSIVLEGCMGASAGEET